MDKASVYHSILKQVDALNDNEMDGATNVLNILTVLKEKRQLFWVGLYYAKPDKLVLGPYKGSLPCTKISYGMGLCGQTAQKRKSHYVNDVSRIENYIACHPETESEIVVPGFKQQTLKCVLDIDSTQKNAFDETDQKYLEQLAGKIVEWDEKP